MLFLIFGCASKQEDTMLVSNEEFSKYSDDEAKVWLLYGMKLNECSKSPIYKKYDCEVISREEAFRYWEVLKSRGAKNSENLDALEKVYLSGFMREYVWFYLSEDSWSKPSSLRIEAFEAWKDQSLKNHTPIKNPGIAFKKGN
mgnify:CR=1 FL=1